MNVAVIQSNYLPWKGYFDILHDADVFIFYDDVQYTTEDWRNRNRIKAHTGPQWLTIPIGADARRQLIHEVALPAGKWAVNHWKTLQQYYGKAPHFKRYAEFFQHVYLERRWTHLAELNQFLIAHIAREFLGIRTQFRDSRDFAPEGARGDRLLDLLKKAGATRYISGPSAQAYIAPASFEAAGIDLRYKSYAGYPVYPQAFPPFAHDVSIIDLLFHVGPEAPYYIWGWRAQETLTAVVPQADPAPLPTP
jgi:hypothetical protein